MILYYLCKLIVSYSDAYKELCISILFVVSNSNSNWTFIALNPPNSKGTLRRNKTKTVNNLNDQGQKRVRAPRRTPGISKAKEGMLWCKGRF